MSTSNSTPHASPIAPRAGRINRVPGLDGVRGIAVAVVMIYHFFGAALPGGFIGVDMFFVLSGFLITSLLLREYATTGRINLLNFWVRRVRRILPAAVSALVVMTVVTGIVGGDPAVGLPTQYFSTLFFLNNWAQIASSQSYFVGTQVFAHYWSLAVEEQFYLLFPLLFNFLRRRGVLWLALASVAGIAGSSWLMWHGYEPNADPTRIYYGTDSHVFGLLIGVGLALWLTTSQPQADSSWPRRRNPAGERVFGTLAGSMALVILAWLLWELRDTGGFAYQGGMLLASLSTAVVVAAVVPGRGILHAAMSWYPLRWLGERSFSLYLWHWPIVVLLEALVARHHLHFSGWVVGIVALLISLPVAAWSYAYIEQPFRREGYGGHMRSVVSRIIRSEAGSNRLLWGIAAATVLVLSSFVALGTAPQETELERDLKLLQEQQSAALMAPPAAEEPAASDGASGRTTEPAAADPAGANTASDAPALPAGDQITAIGDSVMLSSVAALSEQFPGIYVDGEVSRALISIDPVLQGYLAAGTLRPVVFLGFGTNSAIQPETLDDVMALIGPERTVVITLPYGDRTWIPVSRQTITEAAARYDNLYIADWCHVAQSNQSLLREDLIHPTLEGSAAYAQAFLAALEQASGGTKAIPGECGN